MRQKSYTAEGFLSLILLITSIFVNLISTLLQVIVFPYLIIRFRTLILDIVRFKRLLTIVIYFVAIINVLLPIAGVLNLYFFLAVRGLGFIALGMLLLIEWRRQTWLLRSINIVILLIGSFFIYESLFFTYPVQSFLSMMKSNLIYMSVRGLVMLMFYFLLAVFFYKAK